MQLNNEKSVKTAINDRFSADRLLMIHFTENDIKVDVSTGNFIAGDGFRTDGEIEAVNAALAEYDKQLQRDKDIAASKQYWQDVDTLKNNYMTMGEDYLKNNIFEYSFDENGNASLEPKEMQAYGERNNNTGMTNKQIKDYTVEYAEWLSYKKDMESKGIIVEEVSKIDTSDALEYGSKEYIQSMNFLGVTDPNLIKTLTDSLNMARPCGPLQEEIEDAIPDIKNNKNLDAEKITSTACTAAALYIDLVLAGANIEEFSDFFAKQVNIGNINGSNATVLNNPAIVDQYGMDFFRTKSYSEFESFMKSGNMNYGVLRYYDQGLGSEHNINLYRENGSMYVSDVGNWQNHGKLWQDILRNDPTRFRYFQYLQNNNE